MNALPKVAVIGAGQIGSRHLQSLTAMGEQISLHAVEPSTQSRTTAEARLGAAASSVQFHSQLTTLPQELDVAIIATSAGNRKKILSELLAGRRVRHVVLEKIMFQSVADCRWAGEFLALHNVKTWVNFPRRLQPAYGEIGAALSRNEVREIRVTGSQWGLASNAVHFLDLVLFLSGGRTLEILEFVGSTYPSRHPDCLECAGSISGVTQAGQRFSIVAWPDGAAPMHVMIDGPVDRWMVSESSDHTITQHSSAATRWEWQTLRHPFHYQSQLSAGVVANLLKTGGCGLADFDAAIESHVPLLRAWNRFIARVDNLDGSLCPIT